MGMHGKIRVEIAIENRLRKWLPNLFIDQLLIGLSARRGGKREKGRDERAECPDVGFHDVNGAEDTGRSRPEMVAVRHSQHAKTARLTGCRTG